MPAYTTAQWEALNDRQEYLEDTGLARGAERFHKRLREAIEDGTESSMGAAKRLLTGGLEPLEAALTDFITDVPGRRGIKHVGVKWVKLLGPETTAFMALKVVLDHIEQRLTLSAVARKIGDLMLDELRYRRFRELAPQLFEYKMAHFQTTSYSYMARSLDASIRFLKCLDCQKHCANMTREERKAFLCPHLTGSFDDLTLSDSHRLLLGTKLVDLIISTTGIITVEGGFSVAKKNKVKRSLTVVATDETKLWLDKRNALMAFMQPVNMPMVMPPLQWEPGQKGGYRFGLRNKYPMVRGGVDQKQLDVARMPKVYQAINAIQNTAWKINTRVLEVLEQIKENGGGRAGVPLQDRIEVAVPRPRLMDVPDEEIALFEKDEFVAYEKEKAAWKKVLVRNIEANNERHLRCMEFNRTESMARAVKDDEAIYFPFNLDFRGRIYPICTFLSPQGDDLSKGLLTFAQGKPIGEDGMRWLAIHGANCMDTTPEGQKISKMTLDERVAWVKGSARDIEAVAKDPMGMLEWWSSADAPLQFLAFCFEFHNAIGQGPSYVCSLPVSIDGSCNGLQHFSAMLRDEIGGAAVNVIPQDRPQDIYHRIAEHVTAALEGLHSTGEKVRDTIYAEEEKCPRCGSEDVVKTGNDSLTGMPRRLCHGCSKEFYRVREHNKGPRSTDSALATLWLTSGLVDRKLAKRPTMTFGYGSKVFGFQQQLLDYLYTLTDEQGRNRYDSVRAHFTVTADDGSDTPLVMDACALMSQLIWTALQEIVVAASQGMAWLQQCARVLAKDGKPASWVVPATGFPVTQGYYEMKERRICTILSGAVIKPVLYDATAKVDRYKQSNAIAPNVIHSLDAAALMLTVTRAMDEGVESFAAIHDSYGTVPADMSLLARATRQSFVQLYTDHDVVGELHQQMLAQVAMEDVKAIFPIPPQAGRLDVNAVLASDYFFC